MLTQPHTIVLAEAIQWITCLVSAHVRHELTDYEQRYPVGYHAPELKVLARQAVQPVVNQYLNSWR